MSINGIKSYDEIFPMLVHPYKELSPTQNATIMDKINSMITYLNSVGKLTNDVVRDWNNVFQWVMNDGLTTDVNNKLEDMLAKGELNSIIDFLVSKMGDLTTLTTTAKDTIVNAINEIVSSKANQTDLTTTNNKIGDLTNLQTTDKDTIVHAINDNVVSLAQNIQQIKDMVINVKTPPSPYVGAKGDGTTDDTQALQSLINAAIQNGWSLYLPSGVYIISSTLLFAGMKNSSGKGFKFIGQNVKNTFILSKVQNAPSIKFSNINDGDYEHVVEVKDFTINPYNNTYYYSADGLVLENCVGNLYKNINIGQFNNGLLLTSNNDTSVYSTNTGYCEQNVFEDVIINNSVNGLTFQAGSNDTWNSSFHGNIFDRVAISVIGTSTRTAKALNIVSGLIYNCTFNIKMMLGGQNCYLLYFNGDSGTNTGTISYEMFDSNNPKIGTGDNAVAKFFLDGYIYGQLDGGTAIDWSSYTTVQIGQLDYSNNKTAIVAGNSILGRDKFYCLNLIPNKQITSINLYGKTTKLKTLFNTIEDLWGGITHYFCRYQNTSGSQENGFIMTGKEYTGAGSRLILGTIDSTKNDIQDFTEGFDIRLTGSYINSVPNNSKLSFNPNGISINQTTVNIATSKTPASSTAAGTTGDICWDSNYMYVCVATNSWKRFALSTW